MAQRIDERMSSAQFAALPESTQPTELIQGVVSMSPAPTLNHGRVARRLLRRLEDVVPDGEVFDAPTDLVLNGANTYQPDLFWVAADNAHCEEINNGQAMRGVPDLVVEVISPGSARLDRGEKFQVYQASDVREYWLVEPDRSLLEVWQLDGQHYIQHGIYGPDEVFTSPIIGKPISLAGIFPNSP